ncbi:MAG: bifunctional DNA-formamidopyrimidine glycosylase/DNA-(apurinic or apyrimidinic site) lyase [Devosiaceae bacterium]|nr:bifunctional DNA-formamidopyrimidine glycosylase/DNA-(apurinic or apyrimidinic site) lyase [Devosiaceae bacterium]
MPELPEVETIKRGLSPYLINARIKKLILRRKNLRFDFPENFAEQVSGTDIINVSRRAKYLLLELSNGKTLLSHLGMTGNYRFFNPPKPNEFEKHDHVVFELTSPNAPAPFLVYSDPRRFGFMDMFEDAEDCKFLKHLGPEPLGNHLNASLLASGFANRRAPVKTVLLDQKVLAGLGNIYVCEALFRAKIHPAAPANTLSGENGVPGSKNTKNDTRLTPLAIHIRQVLEEALDAGGSTLKDYKSVEGESGYFQHSFDVYGRADENCRTPDCDGVIERIVQAGRSSFFCPRCQAI